MDEASKQELRDRIAKQVWDFEINEQRGAKVSTGMAPWPDDARIQPYCQWAYRHADFALPLVLRLITEAVERVHNQAIAAAATECTDAAKFKRMCCSNLHGYAGLMAEELDRIANEILKLSCPAAELRARIEVAIAVQDEAKEWKRQYGLHPLTDPDVWSINRIAHLTAALAALETQLAALDKDNL